MSNILDDLIAKATSNETPSSEKKKSPIGSIKLNIAGVTLFSRPIWSESTSEEQVINDLNDLSRDEKAKAAEVFTALLPNMEVEITGANKSTVTGLADLMKQISK